MNYSIVVRPETIPLSEVYDNLKNAGAKVMHACNFSFKEYCWAPDGNIEITEASNNTIIRNDLVKCPETFEAFRKVFPASGWHYGYINDED